MLATRTVRLDWGGLAQTVVPAVIGFAVGRASAHRDQAASYWMPQPPPPPPYWGPPDPYAWRRDAQPYWVSPSPGGTLGDHLLGVAATIGGWELGRRLGTTFERGELGRELDRSGIGRAWNRSSLAAVTGVSASSVLPGITGVAGALLGRWLVG